jgi:cell division protein FtsQ
MWNDPDALNRLSRWILTVTLLFSLWIIGHAAVERLAPFWRVEVRGADHPEDRQATRTTLNSLRGGFFSLDLDSARLAFEQQPWVRHAQLRRVWPGQLEVVLEEHRAATAWNDRALLNTHGEVFTVAAIEHYLSLPRLYAPEGSERETARRYGEFTALAKPLGLRVEQIVVNTRGSWRLRLQAEGQSNAAGSVLVELGREHLTERLSRFAQFFPQAVATLGPIARADMRYPNGFAAQPKGGKVAKDVRKA